MRRLAQPSCVSQEFYPIRFRASWEQLKPLGEVHYIENDSMATAGPPEYFWNFETEDGLRLTICYDDYIHFASVNADPPDAEWIIKSLRAAGVAADFEVVAVPPDALPKHCVASNVVWLFVGDGAAGVTAVFSSKSNADSWLRETRFSGVLRPHAIDRSSVKADRGWLSLLGRSISPSEQQTYVSEVGEIYEYENGLLVSGYETWQLWRQDDNGQQFLIQEYRQRSVALKALREFEARQHKQMYWVLPVPFSGTVSSRPIPYGWSS